jgi:regulator of RNase E activity RraA
MSSSSSQQVQGVSVSPGDWVYADWDGILVSKKQLD